MILSYILFVTAFQFMTIRTKLRILQQLGAMKGVNKVLDDMMTATNMITHKPDVRIFAYASKVRSRTY